MSRSPFTVTCRQCRAAFSTPFPQETALLRCPGCAREAPGRDFDYARVAHAEHAVVADDGEVLRAPAKATAFERRGKWILFQCPHCQWAMRIREDQSATSLVDCGRCGLELLPPDPTAGTAASLTRAGVLRLERTGLTEIPAPRRGMAGDERGSGEAEPRSAGDRAPFRSGAGLSRGAIKILGTEPGRRVHFETISHEEAEVIPWEAETRGTLEEDRLFRQARIFRGVTIAAIAVLAVLGLVVHFHEADPGQGPVTPGGEVFETGFASAAAPSDPLPAKAEALAREVAASGDWRALLPHVRHRERVEPLMADYYARHPFVPRRLVSFDAPVSVEVAGRRYLQFSAVSAEGEHRIVGFEEAPEGELAFDWEVYADIAADQWALFRSERPIFARPLRFAFMLASVDDRYYADAGVPREEGIAVRIWFRDREDSLVAVFPKDGFGGVAIERLGSWDVGKLVIGELAFPAGSPLSDRVEFHHLLQERWLVTGDPPEPLF